MKRILVVLLTVAMCFALAACGAKTVVSGFEGTPALNMSSVDEHISRVELTLDNWKDYIREYSYEVEIVERDALMKLPSRRQ